MNLGEAELLPPVEIADSELSRVAVVTLNWTSSSFEASAA